MTASFLSAYVGVMLALDLPSSVFWAPQHSILLMSSLSVLPGLLRLYSTRRGSSPLASTSAHTSRAVSRAIAPSLMS